MISIPTAVVLYFMGHEIIEERHRKVRLVPFGETFIAKAVSDEERNARLKILYRWVMFVAAAYGVLLLLLAMLRNYGLVPVPELT